ncbi:N-acetyltransferase ESCO2 [Trachymyrmex zeteki]|uniref:N-acetyltransferase ESCO2 n=1 Tax=Mycetomoellerius zeteki TaxID=64791 RepID=A0A151WN33_9HYME|nr:N-acetyltransferase ESCO2 [Trachymyrmex zeteki]
MDSSPGKLLYTPRRAQKCLFAPSSDKSAKKSVSRESEHIRDDKSSGDESDLGPMSPLALTDRSPSISDQSTSGREFVSPLATPEKSIVSNTSVSWDRLRFNMEERMSPFRSLKKVTREARNSPRCKMFSASHFQRSLSSSPRELMGQLTPQRSKTNAEQMNEVVPETPQRSFATEIQNQSITETPRKSSTLESKQMTPLSSVSKTVPLPKLHRRKSFSTIETSVGFSPEQKENTLKRRAREQSGAKPTKLFKGDDGFVPKARASLFQERKHEHDSLKDFSLSTKTFYSGNVKKSERPFSSYKSSDIKRRRSLPPQNSSRRSLTKKRKFGKINAGVGHGIKKPKPKVNTEALKNEGQHVIQLLTASSKSSPVEEAQPMAANTIAERAPSPMIDENKRFFKTNKTIRLNQAATVTVNDKIKLKVADGKIELKENQKRAPSTNPHKQKLKAMNVSLDATDLTVDEPEVEATLQQDKVNDLLKILEDDWANDEYDTMASLTHIANAFSPLHSTTTLSKDTIMSPATELSNMTSTMNITDAAPLNNFGNLSLENANNSNKNNNNEKETEKEIEEDTEKKYFPLFNKGYSVPDNIFEETSNANTTKATKRNMQWQLSTKGGGSENQYQLDAGQKRFGAIQCPECNVVYQVGDPEDENAHLNYHNSTRILKFHGWKNERVILEDPFISSRIILIEPHDPKQHWKKVLEILVVVDRDLGLADMNISDYQNKKAKSTPTKCGINVVWTAMSHRKQSIATKLVDTLRAKFFYGYVMSLDDIAFSIPTPSGKIFAEKYTRTKNFKVYN